MPQQKIRRCGPWTKETYDDPAGGAVDVWAQPLEGIAFLAPKQGVQGGAHGWHRGIIWRIADRDQGLEYDPPMSTFAKFDTSEGSFRVRFFDEEVPSTVANFVGLAEGTKSWTDPRTGEQRQTPFYDGIIFHRVIDGFMIQGGDPLGRGIGGPGYKFADEFHPTLRHDRPGVLSMANSGPNTNGSQFFITLGPTPHLDNRHTVFGIVEDGLETVQKIGKVRTGAQDRPVKDVVINKVTIERK
jgi:peptidyl-prolyl cis-trans isomerase A (cyclophilin A)